MTTAATAALGAAALCAVLDWVAVARQNKLLEYVAKPLTLGGLVATAALLEPDVGTRRWWFVAALVLSLAGDIFLMLPRDLFVQGLASFLVAHLAYLVGFGIEGPPLWLVLVIFLVIRAATLPVMVRIAGSLRAEKRTQLAGPVRAYAIVISAMLAAALASGEPWAIGGALLFFLSDFLIAWSRFVTPPRAASAGRQIGAWVPIAIIVTYHLGQMGLVLSLL